MKKDKISDNKLEIMYIKCPLCGEANKWAKVSLTLTTTFVNLNSENTNNKSTFCSKCKNELDYLDIFKAMINEIAAK